MCLILILPTDTTLIYDEVLVLVLEELYLDEVPDIFVEIR